MSLVELIAQADERGLAGSGLACLDRCLPILGGGDDELLRPLWSSLDPNGPGAAWDDALALVKKTYADGPADATEAFGVDEVAELVRRMLDAAPILGSAAAEPGLRAWSDACSVAALQIHRLLDAADEGASSEQLRRGGTADAGPLVAGELRRQVRVLELLSARGSAGGLRQAFDVSMEGRRILRAVVSRRARIGSPG